MSFDKQRILDLIDETELERADGPGPLGWVYFIVCADTFRCKIGFTKQSVGKRLKNLQTGSPGELAVVVQHPGTPDTEDRLHRRFADCRIRGEWFELTDDLRAYMVVALWAMTEITIRQGQKLEPWMSIGVELTLKNLDCVSEGLAELMEAGA